MLSTPVEKMLIGIWGEKNHFLYLSCILGIVLVVLLLTYLLENAEPQAPDTAPQTELRAEFIKNLKQLYTDRLKAKMLGELNFEIKLNLNYTTRGTRPETVDELYIIKNEEQAGDFDRLFHTYTDRLWRLLILGEPGAGKSILLLRFGLRLIEMAENDPGFPIPVLLDLASWKGEDPGFGHWLEANLPYVGGSFAVSKNDAKKLVESQNLLLLLDGFDEIREDDRDACFEKLLPWLDTVKNARLEAYPEVIICSRILEYEAAEDAPVFASVMIRPLTPEDVDAALKPLAESKNFTAAKRLQAALHDSPELYSAITSAFFMHTLLDIAQHDRLDFQSRSKEPLQKEITERYIAAELDKITAYSKEKAKKWLGWLAWKMKYVEGSIAFELIDLQLWWTKRKFSYSLGVGLVFGLIVGLVAGLVFGLILGLIGGLGVGLVFGLVAGLAGGLVSGRIDTQEMMVFDFKKMGWNVIKKSLVLSVVGGLVGSFGVGFGYGVVGSFAVGIDSDLVMGLVDSLGVGLVLGLVGGLVVGLTLGLSVNASFPKVTNPYKRFLAQFWRDTFQWSFIMFFAGGLGVYAKDNLYWGFLLGTFIGPFAAIFYNPIFQHACLRLVLWLEEAIPLKLVTFLDAVSVTGLMIKDGGKWRFRHQLIHDSLADWFEATHPELLRKSDLEKLEKRRADPPSGGHHER